VLNENSNPLFSTSPIFVNLVLKPVSCGIGRFKSKSFVFLLKYSTLPFILFLNNDVEIQDTHALDELRGWCALEDVGVVGGALSYPNGRLQHAGINFLSVRPANMTQPEHFVSCVREVNGVTFAMAMVKRDLYEKLGGLDEFRCPNGFGDALFCHEAGKLGYRVMYTPFATAIHHESLSRGRKPEELELIEMVESGLPIFDLFADCYAEKQPTLVSLELAPMGQVAARLKRSKALRGVVRRMLEVSWVERLVRRMFV